MIGGSLVARFLAARREGQTGVILGNSVSLVGSVAMTSGVGFVYWYVAAFLFPQSAIGIAAASISAMSLLASLGTIGLGTLLLNEIPRHQGREAGLIVSAMTISGLFGFALGILFALTVGAISADFRSLSENPVIVVVFGFGCGLTAAAAVLDYALLASLRSELQFARTSVFAFVKLGLLVVAAGAAIGSQTHDTILVTWIVGLALSLIGVGLYIWARVDLGSVRPLAFDALRRLRGDALRNHALNLALAVPDWTMPILVTAVLTPTASGAFFIAWMMAGVAMFVPASLAQSLNAVVARAPETLPTNLRMTLRLSAAVGVVIWAATALVGPIALAFLGPGYFAAAPALVILALGIFPVAIKAHYVAIGRLEESLNDSTKMTSFGAAIELVLAAVGGVLGGLTGVAIGVLLGLCLQAVLMSPRIRRALAVGLQPPIPVAVAAPTESRLAGG